mgnify:FL=1
MRYATPEGYNAIFVDCIEPDATNYNFLEAMKVAGLSIDVLGNRSIDRSIFF